MNILKTAILLAATVFICGAQGADVVIDRAQTFQTLEGWGHGGGVLGGIYVAAGMWPASWPIR